MYNPTVVYYTLQQETIKVPKCHNNEVNTLFKVIDRGDGNPVKQEILKIESHDCSIPRLTRKDDKYAIAYDGSDQNKIELLHQMIASFMDRFYVYAPRKDNIEMKAKEKAEELIALINKFKDGE